MNLKYLVENLLKNSVMLFANNLLIKRGNLGIDGHPEIIQDTLSRMGGLVVDSPINIKNELVYELGPGRTPYLMMAFILAGAKNVIGLDVRNWMNSEKDYRKVFSDVWSEIEKDQNRIFRKGFVVSDNIMHESLERIKSTIPITYKMYPGDRIAEKDNSVQLLYSKSVLEHIKLNKLDQALKEQYRIIKRGGYALHIIDLRDHLHIRGDNEVVGDWLDALRYPEWLFNALTSNRRAYINRIRANEWRRLFIKSGFEIVAWNERHEELHKEFSPAKLSSRFRNMDEDFTISWIDVLLRK